MSTFTVSAKRPAKRAKTPAAFADDSDDDEPQPQPGPSAVQQHVDDAGTGASLKDRGAALAAAGALREALAAFDQAQHHLPRDVGLHDMRAQVFSELGRHWEAVQAATLAVKLLAGGQGGGGGGGGGAAEVHVTLARAQANLGEAAMAAATYKWVPAGGGGGARARPGLRH
jgi:hypothetical protein